MAELQGSYSKKNQVKHGKYDSIPHPFLGLTLGDKRTPPPRHEIYPQILSAQHLIVRSSKNSKVGGGIIQTSQKEKHF